MRQPRPAVLVIACGIAVHAMTALANDTRPHAGMLQNPDISASQIVFVYANDLWLVDREGGEARPLASPPGAESFPRFSADGDTIAFVGNYDGNRDLYTIGVEGGVPFRVTYHPGAETLCDWTAGGKLVYFTYGSDLYPRANELFQIDAGGGLREKLPVPYGANASISDDGQWLAYTPHTRDHRTWKRYRGGMATDIWLFHLTNHESQKITDWEGTDSQPMWHGKRVYYLSDDGPTHRLNIWYYNTSNGRREQVTRFEDFDVKWPSIGPGPRGNGEIVFQLGGDLMVLDLNSERARKVDVVIPGDRPKIRPQTVDASENLAGGDISPSGKRATVEARGDIWTVPAKHGSPRNLTRTSGVAERDPSWSPDGRWIAYFSDETGEYELMLMQSDGKGETRRLTTDGSAYRYAPTWSPDSKWIAFSDKGGKMYLTEVESGATRHFDTEPWSGQPRMSFASDSKWIAYTKSGANRQSAIWLYDVAEDAAHQVTSGMFNDSWPTFDRKGKYLCFASNREFSSPIYEDVGSTFVYANTDRLYVVPLEAATASPFAPKSDEEKWDKDNGKGDGDKADDDEKSDDSEEKDIDAQEDKDDSDDAKANDDDSGDDDADDSDDDDEAEKADKDKDAEPVKIDLEEFERRAIPLPVERGNFYNLAFNDKGHFLYVRGTARGAEGDPAIKIFDFEDDKRKEKEVLDNANGFGVSADGKKLLVSRRRSMAIVDAKADQKFEDPLDLDLKVTIEPREEWRQLFHEAWRIQRDFFYDPHMHGVDWEAVRKHYAPMIEDCVSRNDVSYVIREMISELNVGHAYYFGGDTESQPRVAVGMPGCDFALDSGAYRISRIVEGGPWDADARGPLSQPGVEVNEGEYLLAVNGAPVDAARSPWAAFVGLADKIVTLTVSEKPTADDDAREVVVELPGGESDLRYRAWIEKNRRHVEEATDGRVGYIYVPNTGVDGQNNLFRQFYGQRDKEALIVDERWNGGGQIPDRFIELLNRPVRNYWARRDGHDWPWPPDAQFGPKCMLINGLAGSGGDAFPHYFKQSQIGPLIGMRTWGGLVGISGNPGLIDGGYTSSPTFAFYEADGTWGIEGHGVDPDIEVVDDPALMVDGGDPQLDTAIEVMLKAIEDHGYHPPARPAYPDRSGMGVLEADK